MEFDARKQLDIVHNALKNFYVSGNLALIRSRVQLPEGSGTQTRNVRPLQGQSPYVVNVTAGWEHPEVSAFATVAYNVVGPRIIAAGSDGQPNTYEQPAHQLDVVVGVPLTETLSISAKAKNLLNARKRVTQGGLDNLYQDRGRAVSASLSWTPRVEE